MKFEKTKEEEYVDMGIQKEEEVATKDIEMHFIEIPKFIKKNPGAGSKLEQWLWLIAGREEKLEMAKKENKELKKTMEIIDEMSMDEKEWELYESRMKAIYDYNTGIHSAKDEGFKERIEKRCGTRHKTRDETRNRTRNKARNRTRNETRKNKNSYRNVRTKNTNR